VECRLTPLTGAAIRAAIAATIVLYLPGIFLARRWGRSLGGGTWVWLLPASLVVLLSGLLAAELAGASLRGAIVWMAICVGGTTAAAILIREPDRARAPHGPGVRPAEWGVIAACTVAFLAVGAPLHLQSDSLDHVAAVRRSLTSGVILPRDEFYRGGDGVGWDPRKGFFHPLLSLICLAARADPLDLWRILPAVLAPGLLLLMARWFRGWLGAGVRSDVALLLWVLVGEGSGLVWLFRAGYPNHVSYALAYGALALWLEHLRRPPGRARLAALALLTGTAELIHLVPGLLVVCGLAFGLGAAVIERNLASLRRSVEAAVAVCVGLIVPVAFRALVQGPVVSTLHTHPQGLFLLGSGVVTASPVQVLEESGWAAVLGLLLLPLALRRTPREERGRLLLFTVSPWILVATPVFTVLYRYLGYLVVRFMAILPTVPVLVLAAEESLVRLRRPSVSGRTAIAAVAIAVLACVVVPSALRLPSTFTGMVRDAIGPFTPSAFPSLLRVLALQEARSRGKTPVVLADPFTSYAATAVTGAYVVSTLNQHGPPTDARWAARLADQRDMLEGSGGDARTDSLLNAYGVDLAIVNTALPMPAVEFSTQVDARSVAAARAHFTRDPVRFPVLYDGPQGLVVRVRRSARTDTMRDERRELFAPAGRAPSDTTCTMPDSTDESARIVSFGAIRALHPMLPRGPLQRGSCAHVVLEWQRVGEMREALPEWVHLRCDALVPRRWYIQHAWSKLGRHLEEHRTGRLYRFRTDQLPFHGMSDLSQLARGTSVRDTLDIRVPPSAAPGRYVVKLALVPEPLVTNLRLRDILRDDDLYDGPAIGWITVR
jgi:hypothetical protein